MPTRRSYRDACGIARALDVVGERWALLVVRELLLGPKRFTDLSRALPGASSNILVDRLRELEKDGVIRRRKMPPPAASSVYELTDSGQSLEQVVLALGAWGLTVPLPSPHTLSATSVLLFLRGSAQVETGAPVTTYRIELDEQVCIVTTDAGEIHIEPGEPVAPDASMTTSPMVLNELLHEPEKLDAAIQEETAVVAGDVRALHRLLNSAASPRKDPQRQ